MVDISKVTRVYNGKFGCMCGCIGKYSVNPEYREEVGQERGYDVGDDEVSERSVKIIAKKVLSNPNVVYNEDYAIVDDKATGRRQVVYFTKQA
jgi:hypothetical protein